MKSLIHGAAAIALSTFAVAGAASAADLPDYVAPPVAAAPASWAGFYVGLHGGGGWADSQSTFQTGADSTADFSLTGPYVGAQIGYNWQTSQNFVFGVEADASWSGIHGVRVTTGPGGTTTQDINSIATFRARLGWLQAGWMPYITGGYAIANGTRTNSAVAETVSASHSGWTVGAGAEFQIANNWTWKAEYKYIDLGSGGYNFTSNASNVDINIHTFEIGLNKHF